MFLGSIQHVFAQEFVPLAEIPNLTKGVVANSEGLATFLNNLYKYLIGFAAMLAIIEIIWGGLEISTKDSVSKQSDGRERITQAIFGLILVLSPVLVFSIINPSILNLSLNLRPINLAVPPTTVPSSGGTGDTTAAKSSECYVANNNGQVACPTQQAANDFAASCSNGTGKTFLTNDSSTPYAASCNSLTPFKGSRSYTDKTQIPPGYWCYTTILNQKGQGVINYACQVSKDACDDLIINQPAEGTYRAGCQQY